MRVRQQVYWGLVITLIGGIILGTGYSISQVALTTVLAAGPLPPDSALMMPERSLVLQATTISEVEARHIQPLKGQENLTYQDKYFNYQVTYPLDWERNSVAGNIVRFQSPEGKTSVQIEAVGPLATTDDLTSFVERSMQGQMVLSRQSLTIDDQSAERIISFSDELSRQVTYFFIQTEDSAYVITGVGQQREIEMIARSFNPEFPQILALQ